MKYRRDNKQDSYREAEKDDDGIFINYFQFCPESIQFSILF